jgi:lycopene cyclase domain-containing protein
VEHYTYLAALIGMAACFTLYDYRLRLAFFADWRRTLRTLVPALILFIVWDLVGIGLNIFLATHSRFDTGILLLPKLPLEEPVFLFNFVYLTLLLWCSGERYVRLRRT